MRWVPRCTHGDPCPPQANQAAGGAGGAAQAAVAGARGRGGAHQPRHRGLQGRAVGRHGCAGGRRGCAQHVAACAGTGAGRTHGGPCSDFLCRVLVCRPHALLACPTPPTPPFVAPQAHGTWAARRRTRLRFASGWRCWRTGQRGGGAAARRGRCAGWDGGGREWARVRSRHSQRRAVLLALCALLRPQTHARPTPCLARLP